MFEELFRKYRASQDILGLNSRTLEYIRPYNKRKAKKIADDKYLAKKILKKAGIPVSKTYAVLKNRADVEGFDWDSLPPSFALKPVHGAFGGGIIVIFNKNKRGNWVGVEGKDIVQEDLVAHVYNTLDGEFSLGNVPDIALFEERIKVSNTFKPYSYKGIPDIRVIVFNNVPLMAMLRLPTKESEGKGNLTQGALGVGIDMSTGVTTTAIKRNVLTHYDTLIDKHPEKGIALSGIKIPFWDEILRISIRSQNVIGLGYIGVDIAVDREHGPLVMEVNARPGISIQNANNEGLAGRLRRVKGLKVDSVKKGVRIAKDLFGGEIEEEVEEATGKNVISTVEKVTIDGVDGISVDESVRIDTGAASTSICTELADKLGFDETLEKFNRLDFSEYYGERIKSKDVKRQNEVKSEIMKKYGQEVPNLKSVSTIFSSHGMSIRPVIEFEYVMDGQRIKAEANVTDRGGLFYKMLVGRKDLKGKFLVEVEE